MDTRVKEFIEDNIELINSNKWHDVFEEWYQTMDETDTWLDDVQIVQFFDVISILGVTLESTYDIRANILTKHFEAIVNDAQHNHYNRIDTWYLSWDRVIFDLNSCLGMTANQLNDILNELDLAGVTPDRANKRFAVEGL